MSGDVDTLPPFALMGGAFALLAIGLEVWSSWGTGARVDPPMSWLVATGWPTPVRVVWWAAATGGVLLANRGLARATGTRRRAMTVLAVAPFLAFTVGIAVGAEWATWH